MWGVKRKHIASTENAGFSCVCFKGACEWIPAFTVAVLQLYQQQVLLVSVVLFCISIIFILFFALFSFFFSVACSILKVSPRLRHSCSKLACVGGRAAMVHQFGCKCEVEGNWHSVEITGKQFLQFLLIYYHVVQPNNTHASCLAEDRL